MGFGDLFNATAKGLSSDIDQRQQTAMQYKMHSALIQQQLMGQQQVEQEKFDRENTLPIDVSNSMLKNLSQNRVLPGGLVVKGLDVSGIDQSKPQTLASMKELMGLHQQNMQAGMLKSMMNMPGQPMPVKDPVSGLTQRYDVTNQLGGFLKSVPDRGYTNNLERWKVIQGSNQRLDMLKGLYDAIPDSFKGPIMGNIGSMLAKTGMSETANTIQQFTKAMNEAGPLIALSASKIPGGRYSGPLHDKISSGTLDMNTAVRIAPDLMKDMQFQNYLETKSMGANAPSYQEQMFGQIPTDQNGIPTQGAFFQGRFHTADEINHIQAPLKQQQNNPGPTIQDRSRDFAAWQQKRQAAKGTK